MYPARFPRLAHFKSLPISMPPCLSQSTLQDTTYNALTPNPTARSYNFLQPKTLPDDSDDSSFITAFSIHIVDLLICQATCGALTSWSLATMALYV